MKADKQNKPDPKDNRPCPDRPKGERCPVCGGAWVCLQSWRPKAAKAKKD